VVRRGHKISEHQHPSSSPGGAGESGTAEVHHHAPGIAIVTMHGEHDLSTEPALSRALEDAAAHSNVLVDLSECEFIDSTVIAALLRVARSVTERGERFALLIPAAQRQIDRIAQMTHLGELLPIHPTREAALASLQEPPTPDAAA
jgi:anti-sigma B factor antagonist